MRKQRLYFTILEVIMMLGLSSGIACQHLHKHRSLNKESVIAQAELYESAEDKKLVSTYQPNLEAIYHKVRARYEPHQLEFFMITGISFRKIRISKSFDTYLSLNTKSSKFFSDDTTFEERASLVFTHYLKPLLTIAVQERTLMHDSALAGVAITTRWKVKKLLKEKHRISLSEQVSLITHKEQIDKFLTHSLTDQELLDQSTLISTNEEQNSQIIKLHLK